MTIKLTAKAIDIRNARLKAARRAEHVERNIDRAILATIDREDRRRAGIARRDAHNADLKTQAARLSPNDADAKTQSLPVTANDHLQPAMAA